LINIICSKWGDLYSDHYVENLYASCKDKFAFNFHFYCISDNTDKIKGIQIVDPPSYNVWNNKNIQMFDAIKMYYFQEDFLKLEGNILAFDLDVVILDNLHLPYNRPTIVWKYWRSQQWFDSRRDQERTQVNSSMIYWEQNSMVEYFKSYKEKEDEYLQKYPGTDNYHQYNGNYNWSYFDELTVYSYDQGATEQDTKKAKYRPAYPVCIFNGESPAIDSCNDWVKDYWISPRR
jgi:hypothetical protein